ncbi:hypothetical protein CONLIGDRAFT_315939 [Coniochaeta ligniaria NRRL 30616]|uniref:Uncharacterized protein n=1 Tax=Coniochaeta ligniaria NRRL 30616 TaxID=1408157 RepID=A0A1J7IV52_9PEZI|nr:hypothetical protein CONLIGDRAFT_315939 [Coniochaeta ligniaria NRRL 30616]
MSRLFRRPSSKGVGSMQDDPNSVFSSLLNPVTTAIPTAAREQQPGKPPHRRTKSSPGVLATQDQLPSLSSRPWLSLVVAERQTSWTTGERPPKRKLVKDPGSAGSARPSFSHELSDHGHGEEGRKEDGRDKGFGIMRRGVERIRELYRREKG